MILAPSVFLSYYLIFTFQQPLQHFHASGIIKNASLWVTISLSEAGNHLTKTYHHHLPQILIISPVQPVNELPVCSRFKPDLHPSVYPLPELGRQRYYSPPPNPNVLRKNCKRGRGVSFNEKELWAVREARRAGYYSISARIGAKSFSAVEKEINISREVGSEKIRELKKLNHKYGDRIQLELVNWEVLAAQ